MAPCTCVVGDAEEALVGKTWDGPTGDGPSAAWRKWDPGKEGLPRSSARWERCRRRSAVPAPGNPAGRLGKSPRATSAGRNATLEALIPDPVLAKLSFAGTTRAECGASAHTPRAGGRRQGGLTAHPAPRRPLACSVQAPGGHDVIARSHPSLQRLQDGSADSGSQRREKVSRGDPGAGVVLA